MQNHAETDNSLFTRLKYWAWIAILPLRMIGHAGLKGGRIMMPVPQLNSQFLYPEKIKVAPEEHLDEKKIESAAIQALLDAELVETNTLANFKTSLNGIEILKALDSLEAAKVPLRHYVRVIYYTCVNASDEVGAKVQKMSELLLLVHTAIPIPFIDEKIAKIIINTFWWVVGKCFIDKKNISSNLKIF